MTLKDFINQLHTVVDKSILFRDNITRCQVTDVIIKGRYIILIMQKGKPKYFRVDSLVRKLLTLDENKTMFIAYICACFKIYRLDIRTDEVIICSSPMPDPYIQINYGC